MHSSHRFPARAFVCAILLALTAGPRSLDAQSIVGPEWQEVAAILQAPPADAGGYVRFNLPRKDLTVRIGDVMLPPAFALTSWVGFDGSPDSAVAMGDIVVTAAELGPVLAELARQGVEVTAIHNHLVGETPQVTYIHYHVEGTAAVTARALDAALRLTAVPRPVIVTPPAPLAIDTGRVFAGLGKSGKAAGSMAQVSFMLVPGPVMLHGAPLRPALAYGSPVNVLQLSPARAVATGDFAVTEAQLDPLLKALAAGGITATATHNHLVGEAPRIYFVHFWGDAPLEQLVGGLRRAVDAAMEK